MSPRHRAAILQRASRIESLERRVLLAVTASVNAQGRLDVSSDGSDAITITVESGLLKINGNNPSTGPVMPGQITEINIQGGPGPNNINLANVTLANGFVGLDSKVTVDGNDGNDTITGSAFADHLNGKTGADLVDGGPGNDTLDGGSGNDNDTLIGGTGNDCILGGAGNDSLVGGDGDDTIFGGLASNIDAGAGNDLIVTIYSSTTHNVNGGSGTNRYQIQGSNTEDDTIIIQAAVTPGFDQASVPSSTMNASFTNIQRVEVFTFGGNDTITVGTLNASTFVQSLQLFGGTGNDTISIVDQTNPNIPATLAGEAGNDTLAGGSGANRLAGGDNDDLIFGGLGPNTITGDAGNDSLLGGPQNDLIFGNLGNDSIDGGAGNDTVTGNQGDDLVTASSGNNQVFGEDGNDTLMGGMGNDTLVGGNDDDTLVAGVGPTLAFGDAGNDVLVAGLNSTLVGGTGNDLYRLNVDNTLGVVLVDDTGGGTDTLDFSPTQNANLNVNLGATDLQTVHANLQLKILPVDSVENVIGGGGNDNIIGNNVPNLLRVSGGNNTIAGNGGNDTIIIDAPNANNSVNGGTGSNTLIINGSAVTDDTFTVSATATDLIVELDTRGPSETTANNIEEVQLNGVAGLNTYTVQPLLLNTTLQRVGFFGGPNDDFFNILDPVLTVNIDGGGGNNGVRIDGRANFGDIFGIDKNGQIIRVDRTAPVPATINIENVSTLEIDGLDGDNEFTVNGPLGLQQVRLRGGSHGNKFVFFDPDGDYVVDGGSSPIQNRGVYFYDVMDTIGDRVIGVNADGSRIVLNRSGDATAQVRMNNIDNLVIGGGAGSGASFYTIEPLGSTPLRQITIIGGPNNDTLIDNNRFTTTIFDAGPGNNQVHIGFLPTDPVFTITPLTSTLTGSDIATREYPSSGLIFNFPTGFQTPVHIITGDVNGDGIDDIITVDQQTGETHVTFGVNPYAAAVAVQSVQFVQIQGSADRDLITVSTDPLVQFPPIRVNLFDNDNKITFNGGLHSFSTFGFQGGVFVDTDVLNGTVDYTMGPDEPNQSLGTVKVFAPGRVTVQGPPDATANIGALELEGGATPAAFIDINTHALIINEIILRPGPDGVDPLATVAAQIAHAYNKGAWNMPGITSSMANADSFGIGFALASDIFTSFPAMFMGHEVSANDILVRFTRYGDADLSGTVNLQDFNRLAANFGATTFRWSSGDFDYNNTVNLQDFNRMAANFGQVRIWDHYSFLASLDGGTALRAAEFEL